MSKVILTCSLLFLTLLGVLDQCMGFEYGLGVDTGLNYCRFKLEPSPPAYNEYKYRITGSTYLNLRMELFQNLELEIGPGFIEKGSNNLLHIAPNWTERLTFKLYYGSFQLGITEKFFDIPVKPSIYGAFQINYLFKSTVTHEGYGITNSFDDSLKKWDFALLFGVGVMMKTTGGLSLSIKGLYSMGIVDIMSEGMNEVFKNEGFQVIIGIHGWRIQ
ncbi:PorT family protein [bacterium]|nr:PorT family protein [bacterium]